MSTLLDELLAAERAGWTALSGPDGAAFYRDNLTDDAVMVFSFGPMDRATALHAMATSPPWSTFEIRDPTAVALTPDSGVLVYRVTAAREGQPTYEAVVSSAFVRSGRRWLLALHQQTPADDLDGTGRPTGGQAG